MKKDKILYGAIFLGVIALIFVIFILSLGAHDWYQTITKPYFSFLQKIGYYNQLYDKSCARGIYCFLINLPHNAPYLFFISIPFFSVFFLLYYGLSNDKKSLKEMAKALIQRKEYVLTKPLDVGNKKHSALFNGLIVAFFILIGLLVSPILIVLFFNLYD